MTGYESCEPMGAAAETKVTLKPKSTEATEVSLSICSESAFRNSLSDAEFWEYVLLGNSFADGDDEPSGFGDYEGPPDLLDDTVIATLCPVCGSLGACAYDAEGLPLIHSLRDD